MHQGMCIFVVAGVKRRRPLRIQPQHDVVLLSIAVKNARRMHMLRPAPFIRSNHPHRRFVPGHDYSNRLHRINAQLRKRRMKQRPNLFEISRDPSSRLLARIARHHEVRRSHLRPAVRDFRTLCLLRRFFLLRPAASRPRKPNSRHTKPTIRAESSTPRPPPESNFSCHIQRISYPAAHCQATTVIKVFRSFARS